MTLFHRSVLFVCGGVMLMICSFHAAIAQTTICSAQLLLNEQLEQQPALHSRRVANELNLQQLIDNQPFTPTGVITIPVVIHVVYQTPAENISDAQIMSQLDVLNQDFRAANTNQDQIPTAYQDDLADVEIEFCLAQQDPNGYLTTGINRIATNITYIGIKNELYDTAPAWDNSQYLNIWVANMGGGLNGQATFPDVDNGEKDGIVISPTAFGTTGTAAANQPYHLGRTLTHEIGHYLNLYHPWGTAPIPDCDEQNDLVSDTPITANTFVGECPSGIVFSCGNGDMWPNYMYYTDDACMAMFTQGQKQRMRASIEQYRSGLLTSVGCEPGMVSTAEATTHPWQVYPNLTTDRLTIQAERSTGAFSLNLYDMQGRKHLFQTCSTIETSLEVGHLARGVYFLLIENAHQKTVKKIVLF